MLAKITGPYFKKMVTYGINRLEKYCDAVNDLNVFPVPDGDTGTNMVMTLKNGLQALGEAQTLGEVAQGFANGAVFGARGNSGVIISQFFKGVSEGFKGADEADATVLSSAFDTGCKYAYAAVTKPVEGTVLTVLRESSAALKENLANVSTIDGAVSVLLEQARITLKNTPNLLAILAKAGVIDSGGAGVVYLLEGFQRCLNGEQMEEVEAAKSSVQYIDYSAFNKNSVFEYGYCTETLLQLTTDSFDSVAFTRELSTLGDSIVTSFEGDKVKVHIHTRLPEKVLAFCHNFGEFLSLKIENMSVQHTQSYQKYLVTNADGQNNFAIIAVAPNGILQKMFSDMGADISMLSAEVPSSQNFIEAFEHVTAKEILVFPNNANSILSAIQAGSLYKKANVTVIKSRSVAECYSAMAAIDFDEADASVVADAVHEVIENIYEVDVVRAARGSRFGDTTIAKGDYFSMAGDEILVTGGSFESVVLDTVKKVISQRECSVVNLFYGQGVSEQCIENLGAELEDVGGDFEVCIIPTQDIIYDLILSFE